MNDKVRLVIMIDPELKQAMKDYGAQPGIDRDMSWLASKWIEEGLARAERNDG